MWPSIPSGSLIEVIPCKVDALVHGDIAAYERAGRVVVHRVRDVHAGGVAFTADALSQVDALVSPAAVLGKAHLVEARALTYRLPTAGEALVLGRALWRRMGAALRRVQGVRAQRNEKAAVAAGDSPRRA
jgi:hypothetical protein